MEHSIEVQLPFLQYIYDDDFKIVPITVGYSDYGMCEDVGKGIADAIKETEIDTVIIASTDFTHYGATYGYAPVGMVPFQKVLKWVYDVDNSIIDRIICLDPQGLVKTVEKNGYTVCGSLPVATMIIASKKLGADYGKLLKYATSYDTKGSQDVIVGYGAVIVISNNLRNP
jgi:AmmeMemoRadiSam system protein B